MPPPRSQPAGPSQPRRLSGEDAVFVHAETPSMPMHTLGTLILDPSTVPGGRFDRAHLIRHVKQRIHQMPPFRQRLLEVPLSLGSPVLADDPEFRVEHHVHRVVARRPGTPRELARVVEEIAAQPLDRSKPLWEMWLVEGLADGRCAVVTKMHHCMIDGASGASQMANLLDFAPDAESPKPPRFRPGPLPSGWALVRDSLANPRDPRELARLAQSTAAGLFDRVRAGDLRVAAAGRAAHAVERTGRARAGASPSAARRSTTSSSSRARFGVTVNDAVLAACTLALRRYLEARDALPEQPLACAVPVSVKSEEELRHFSNKVSVMSVRLPTHLDDPAAIVRAVQRRDRAGEAGVRGLEPGAGARLARLGARSARRHRRAALHARSSSPIASRMPWNCVVSNMRGAPFPLYFAGARVLATYPMGPAGDGVGLNITVLSNMGRLDFGVLAAARRGARRLGARRRLRRRGRGAPRDRRAAGARAGRTADAAALGPGRVLPLPRDADDAPAHAEGGDLRAARPAAELRGDQGGRRAAPAPDAAAAPAPRLGAARPAPSGVDRGSRLRSRLPRAAGRRAAAGRPARARRDDLRDRESRAGPLAPALGALGARGTRGRAAGRRPQGAPRGRGRRRLRRADRAHGGARARPRSRRRRSEPWQPEPVPSALAPRPRRARRLASPARAAARRSSRAPLAGCAAWSPRGARRRSRRPLAYDTPDTPFNKALRARRAFATTSLPLDGVQARQGGLRRHAERRRSSRSAAARCGAGSRRAARRRTGR